MPFVKKIRHFDGDNIEIVVYKLNGKKHREDDGPAKIIRECGKITDKYWCRKGKKHRDGKPALKRYNAYGLADEKVWYQKGKKHRDDGPARIYYDFAYIIREEWYQNGKKHRVDGPAEVSYKGEKIEYEAWYRGGVLYFSGVLAVVIYYELPADGWYYTGEYSVKDIDRFRNAVKGNAIHDALRPLPIPIRQAIAAHYCYQ